MILYTLENYTFSTNISNFPLADCMSFSCEFKTLRNENSYDLRMQPKMSTHGDENTGASETGITEGSEEGNIRLSPELVDERIKAYRDDGQINPEQFDQGI